MPRVTLKMIAEKVGVSTATVSMALSGQGKISSERVEIIRKIADDMGYTPDPVLASLASRRFRSGEQAQGLPLALLEFPAYKGAPATPINYRQGLIAEAERLGYAPHVYSHKEITRYQDITRVLFHRGTKAIIITGQPDLSLFEDAHRWREFAIAQCGRYQSMLPLNTIRPNIFQAVKLAFNQALSRGYRKIGFALGHHNIILEDDIARHGAALAHIDRYLNIEDHVPPYFGLLTDKKAITEWAQSHNIDAFIGFTINTWFTLKDADIVCPRDAGYIAFHLTRDEKTHPMSYHISGLNQSVQEIARQAIHLVDQMVRHNDRGLGGVSRQILLDSEWVEGDTLPVKGEPLDYQNKIPAQYLK